METSGQPGPVIVCLEHEQHLAPLVRCGTAMALLLNASLYLAVVLVLPSQRPLDLTDEEEQAAETLLNAAGALAAESGLEPSENIWVGRSWQKAIEQMVEEVSASALVTGWRASGPFHLFDAGRTLLRAIPCPVIMVGQGQCHHESTRWPPLWLVKANLHL